MDLQRWIRELVELVTGEIQPITRNVLVITFAPPIPSRENRPLFEAIPNWNNPDGLIKSYVEEIHEISHGYANYNVVDIHVVPDFTPLIHGNKYTPELYLSTLDDHQAKFEDKADYNAILESNQCLEKIASGIIDEVWLMGYPYAGFQESRMGGVDPFWCNGDNLLETEQAGRRFIVMGFNYERGIGEMLEDMGHRAESILSRVYADQKGEANLWERFSRIDWYNPGQAEVGTVHHGPNAILSPDLDDHQWTETRFVPSRHTTWAHYPDLTGGPEPTNCDAWKDVDMTKGHHKWWFSYFPHKTGLTNGIYNNWWKYVIDPNTV